LIIGICITLAETNPIGLIKANIYSMKKFTLILLVLFLSNSIWAQFSSDFTIETPTANNSCDGWLAVYAGGGTAPYTSVWNGTDTLVSGSGVSFHNDTLWNLCPGTYFVDVLDALGNDAHYNFFITSPDYTFGSQITPQDSIVSLFIEDCSFDYSIPVDTVFLNNTTLINLTLDVDTLISSWVIVQNSTPHTILDTAIGFFPVTSLVLDAAIYCPDSVFKSSNLIGTIIHASAPVAGGTLSNGNGIERQSISIFPNPFSESISIKSFDSEYFTSYEILTLSGQVVLSEKGLNSSFKSVDVSHLSNGVYMIRIALTEGFSMKKLIKY